MALVSCRTNTAPPVQDPTPPVSAPVATPVVNPTSPPSAPKPVAEPLRLAILLSDSQPEYDAVRVALVERAGDANVDVYDLRGQAPRARDAIRELRTAGHHNVVAIGLLAARAARQLDAETVVFCQVLNHQEHDLQAIHAHGVSSIPPLDEVAHLWIQMGAPTRIGVITGDGHDQLVGRARDAFEHHGIELVHRITTSDKETVLELQRMLPDIQGYWLLPDNRVLSRTALRDLMSLTRRRNVGVLVHDPRFLDLGGWISAVTAPEDIAAVAYQILVETLTESPPPFGMRPLRECRIQVDPDTAVRLGYRLDVISPDLLAR